MRVVAAVVVLAWAVAPVQKAFRFFRVYKVDAALSKAWYVLVRQEAR